MPDPDRHVTRLLHRMQEGDSAAAHELLPLVYEALHQAADSLMRKEREHHTLRPTALVHEAWLRLAQSGAEGWDSTRHFLGVAALAMRQALVDHARRRNSVKRGGEYSRVPFESILSQFEERNLDVLALDEALVKLHEMDPELARLVELRFFAGLTIDETAQALSLSSASVERRWRFARAWLRDRLADEPDGAD